MLLPHDLLHVNCLPAARVLQTICNTTAYLLTRVLLYLQFAYMMLVGTFPFNSFLAGLLCSLAFFSLTGDPQYEGLQECNSRKQQQKQQ
jgi:hypothetical protein